MTVLALTLPLFLPINSQAAPEVIVDSSGTNATGVRDFEVGGKLCNVAFLYDTANNLYGDPPKPGFDTDEEILDASESLEAALNKRNEVVTGYSNDKHIKLWTPATYRIEVEGHLDASWSVRLAGMHITTHKKADQHNLFILLLIKNIM